MDFSALSDRWVEVASERIAATARAHPGEVLYAAGFTTFHADYTAILQPALAMNVASHVAGADLAAGYPTRWEPNEWRFPVSDEAVAAMASAYDPLGALGDTDDAAFEVLAEEHYRAIARACRRLTAAARAAEGALANACLPSDFVVAILYSQDGEAEYRRLIEMSVEPSVLARFPEMRQL